MEELTYFFSYAREDLAFVLRLAKELREAGINLWLDQFDIIGGQRWDDAVEAALQTCQGMIAVLSPEAMASHNVMDEVSYALEEGKTVIPIFLRSCPIPFRLRRVQHIDFTADYQTGFSQLLRALRIDQPLQPRVPAAPKETVVQDVTASSQETPKEVPTLEQLPRRVPFGRVPQREEKATLPIREKDQSVAHRGRSVAMRETFGSRLKQFALAVDIVDEDIFKQVWDLVRRYVSRDLELTYWALFFEGEVNGYPGLQARESSTGVKPSFSLTTAEGSYNGLAAYAFAKATKLWVVSPDKQPLDRGTHLQDLWSNTDPKRLPAYAETKGVIVRTVIETPLRCQGRMLGVLELQMSQYYEATNATKEELELLADTLSELLVLAETNQMKRAHTRQAIAMLRAVIEETESWPPLMTKPQIFVASSDRADAEVMGTIRGVLDNFQDRLRIYYWRDSPNGGNINWETLREVKASRFGLCYFSEPAEDARGEFKYQDNVNVVFEAGMFQSLTNPAATDAPIGWIPVREPIPLSPSPPFDFAQQRMIVIPRLRDNNRLNIERLRTDLRARIENLLEVI